MKVDKLYVLGGDEDSSGRLEFYAERVVKASACYSRTQVKDRPSLKDTLLLDFTPTPTMC